MTVPPVPAAGWSSCHLPCCQCLPVPRFVATCLSAADACRRVDMLPPACSSSWSGLVSCACPWTLCCSRCPFRFARPGSLVRFARVPLRIYPLAWSLVVVRFTRPPRRPAPTHARRAGRRQPPPLWVRAAAGPRRASYHPWRRAPAAAAAARGGTRGRCATAATAASGRTLPPSTRGSLLARCPFGGRARQRGAAAAAPAGRWGGGVAPAAASRLCCDAAVCKSIDGQFLFVLVPLSIVGCWLCMVGALVYARGDGDVSIRRVGWSPSWPPFVFFPT